MQDRKIAAVEGRAVRTAPSRTDDERPLGAAGSARRAWLGIAMLVAVPGAAAGMELAGRVLDPAGRPVPGAALRLEPAAGEARALESDAEGRFRFAGLEPGDAGLRVWSEGFEPWRRRLELAPGSGEVVVRLRLAAVEGEIEVTSSLPGLAGESRIPGREVLDSGAVDLAGYFREVAGLGAVRRGPINLEPSIRGLQEEQVGLFVDGTRTFAAGPARMDSGLSHLAPRMVDGVRVVKGPYALAWGAGALSAVQVETFRPPFAQSGFRWGGGLGASYAANGEVLDAAANAWGAGGKGRLYVSAGRRQGEAYEAGDGAEIPAGFTSEEARWRFGYRPRPDLLLEASGGYQGQNDIDYFGRLLDATYFYTNSHALEATWSREGSAFEELYGQLYRNRRRHRMNNDGKPTARPAPGRTPPFALRVDLPTEATTSGGRLRVAFGRGEAEWSLGLDHYRLEQRAERFVSRRDNDSLLFRDTVWPDAEIRDLGLWVQWVRPLGPGRFGATLRLDEVDASAGAASEFFLANTTGELEQGETHVSAAVSWAVATGEHWSWTLGLGRSVRTATVLERYSDRFPASKFQLAAEFVGDPTLDPEASLELDVAGRARWGELFLEVAAFYRVIDDYITVVPDPTLPRRLPLSPPVVYRYANGTEATFVGAELSLRQRLGRRVAWRGEASWTRAEDEALDEPVLGIRPLEAKLGFEVKAYSERASLELLARFADRQDRVAVSRFERETPGYTVFDLAARFELDPRWTLRAAVENLGDRRYSEHQNAPNPFTGERVPERGRSVSAGFDLRF